MRHGETIWHAENRYTGRTDVPLTDHGHEQATLLARWAKSAGLVACWSSTLGRARATVLPAAEAVGLTAWLDPRLCEIDFGAGEGLTAAELRDAFGERYAAFQVDPFVHHLPQGEEPADAVRRATSCLDDIARQHPDGRVLVVWHSTLMRLVLCRLLGIPPSEYRRVFPFVRNVGITEVRHTSGGHWSLLQYNAPIDP